MELKKLPTWLKTLGVISIILILIDIFLIILISFTNRDPIETSIVGGLLISFLIGIIGIWLAGSLLAYFKQRNKIVANILLICFLGFLFIIPFNKFDIDLVIWPIQLMVAGFFIVSIIIINKK